MSRSISRAAALDQGAVLLERLDKLEDAAHRLRRLRAVLPVSSTTMVPMPSCTYTSSRIEPSTARDDVDAFHAVLAGLDAVQVNAVRWAGWPREVGATTVRPWPKAVPCRWVVLRGRLCRAYPDAGHPRSQRSAGRLAEAWPPMRLQFPPWPGRKASPVGETKGRGTRRSCPVRWIPPRPFCAPARWIFYPHSRAVR